MKLRGSHLVAFAIMAAVGGWMFTGDLVVGGQVDASTPTIAQREAERKTQAFQVRVETIQPSERTAELKVRGRTSVETRVAVRAEVGGTVEARPVSRGQMVKSGDLLCEIDKGVRSENLAQAEAQLEQAREDYIATEKLVKRGFATRTKLRALQSALNAAEAAVANAKQDMERTVIHASVAGVVHDPIAEVGDNLAPGGVCVTLLDTDPMLFKGQVSERDIGKLSIGMRVDVKLISGQFVIGKLRYIAPAADPATRTFAIEVELPNQDGALRDGLTAEAVIPLSPAEAYKVQSAWLTLDDDGQIGIRAVGRDNIVAFYPVKILAQGAEEMWVSGLKPELSVITLGQNYVIAGQKVVPVTAEQMAAQLQAAEAAAEQSQNAGASQ